MHLVSNSQKAVSVCEAGGRELGCSDPLLPCRGSTVEEATQNIIDVQIPAIHELCKSGSLSVDNIDVFCETEVFNTDFSQKILTAGKHAGWKINFHGDEFHSMNSGEVCPTPHAFVI